MAFPLSGATKRDVDGMDGDVPGEFAAGQEGNSVAAPALGPSAEWCPPIPQKRGRMGHPAVGQTTKL